MHSGSDVAPVRGDVEPQSGVHHTEGILDAPSSGHLDAGAWKRTAGQAEDVILCPERYLLAMDDQARLPIGGAGATEVDGQVGIATGKGPRQAAKLGC